MLSSFSTFKSYKWDSQRSARWNQDAQREEGIMQSEKQVIWCSLNFDENHWAFRSVENRLSMTLEFEFGSFVSLGVALPFLST